VRWSRDLLAWADGQERAEECVRLFLHLGVVPSADEAGAQASRALSPIGRLAEVEWLVLASEPAAAAKHLRALAEEPERGGLGLETLTERTRRFAQRGEREALVLVLRAARVIDGAESGAGGRAGASRSADTGASAGAQRLDLLEILSGAGSPEVRARFLARAAAPASRLELIGLGALAEGPSGEEARAILVRAVAAYTPGEDVVAGLEVALSGIRAARDDLAERDLVLAVRREAREGPPELRLRFAVDAWPARERPEPVRGRDSDRSLAGSTLR
jgi:hypothetical protein